jgi:hypothetical protein
MQAVEEVVEHPLTQDEAYTKAYRWAAENYGSANEVIQMEDRDSGTLILKGVQDMSIAYVPAERGLFEYTLTLDIRDKKMRLTFDPEGWASYGRTSNADVENSLEDFRNSIKPSLMTYLEEDDDF